MAPIFNVALPVFGLILAGYLSGRMGWLGSESSTALNRFVYWMALPALLFVGMAKVPVREVLNWPFLAAFGGGTTFAFALAFAVNRAAFPSRLAEQTLRSLSTAFANVGYMGVPLYLAAFGPERTLPALIATVFVSAIAVAGAVALIELDLASGNGKPRILRDIGLALLKNPLVVMPLAGLALSAAGARLPLPIETFCSLLGAAAGPCALFAIGLFLVGKPLVGNWTELGWISLMKLVVQPAATWVLAVPVLQLEPFWAGSAVLLSALPTGALVFTLAQNYEVWPGGASTAILVTTVLSVVTVSAILVLSGLT
ncbi:MAG: AEC family transporter [Rhodospirillales bacterium]|nr:AEC family transporter [Rhodospirillales bacterium]